MNEGLTVVTHLFRSPFKAGIIHLQKSLFYITTIHFILWQNILKYIKCKVTPQSSAHALFD
jgi:hypothetical protein